MTHAIALAILALLTIGPGRYAPHVEHQAMPAYQWAQQRAEWIERASDASGIPNAVLVALIFHESGFKDRARSKVGAEGPMQLMPGTPHHRAWMQVCAKDPYYCSAANVEQGAITLAKYRRQCGTLLRGLSAYRIGRCQEPGPRAWATVKLAWQVSFRLQTPSSRPLVARRLP